MISYVILYCEEDKHYLSGCLESLIGFNNHEVILVKTEKTGKDSMIEIEPPQTHLNVKHYYLEYKDLNFSDMRNKALEKVTKEYVFMIDADERITLETEELRKIYEIDADAYACIMINFTDKGTITNNQIRIFKSKYRYKLRSIHEDIALDVMDNGGVIEPTTVLMKHLGYIDSSEKKAKRNLPLLLKDLAKIGNMKHANRERDLEMTLQYLKHNLNNYPFKWNIDREKLNVTTK